MISRDHICTKECTPWEKMQVEIPHDKLPRETDGCKTSEHLCSAKDPKPGPKCGSSKQNGIPDLPGLSTESLPHLASLKDLDQSD